MFSVPAATTTAPASTRAGRSVAVDVLDARRLAVLDHDPLDARVGAQLEPAGRPGVVDVRVERRLARVRRAALEARAAAHAVRVGVRAHRLELGAERAEAGLDGAHALRPVGALADAEPLLDAVVVRVEVGRAERRAARADEPARLVPLGAVLRVRAQRHLRVDRRRAADAAAAEQPDRAAGAAVDQREPDRPPEIVRRLRLPAREVGARSGAGRPRAAARCRPRSASSPATTPPPAPEPTTTTSKRSLIRSIPRYDQSFAEPRGEGSVEVDLRPGAGRVDAGRDEVAVERLDRERPHLEKLGRADVLADLAVCQRRERGERRRPRRLVHPREQRVDVDRRAHAGRAGDDRVANRLHHPGRLGVEHLQGGHAAMISQAD